MPFIPVPSAILAEMVYSTAGGVATNTLWFTSPLEHDAPLLQELAILLDGWHASTLADTQSADVELVTIRVTSQETDSSPAIEHVVAGGRAGNIAEPALPNNVTAAVTFITQFRGRSNRGRNYVVGVPEGSVVKDTFDSTRLAAILASYEDMRVDTLSDGFTHVVASRYSGVDGEGNPIPRISGQTTPVTTYKMDNTIDSQRRRLLHRGA